MTDYDSKEHGYIPHRGQDRFVCPRCGCGTFRYYPQSVAVRLFHYGTCLGGIRHTEVGTVPILGYPLGYSDCIALNTMWKHYGISKRVRIRQGFPQIISVEEGGEESPSPDQRPPRSATSSEHK